MNKEEKLEFILKDTLNEVEELIILVNKLDTQDYNKKMLINCLSPMREKLSLSLHGKLDEVYDELEELYKM